jgi:hypothetical protein
MCHSGGLRCHDIYIVVTSFIRIGSGIQKLIWSVHTHTGTQHGDDIILLQEGRLNYVIISCDA